MLVALSVLKMILITTNKKYTRSTMKMICNSLWAVAFVLCVAEFTIYKLKLYPRVRIMRRVWSPLLTFPAILVFLFCFGRIYYVNQKVTRRFSRQQRDKGNFKKIAIAQVSAFVFCIAPLSVYDVGLVTNQWYFESTETILRSLQVLSVLHPVIDSIVFFIVYKDKWRKKKGYTSSTSSARERSSF